MNSKFLALALLCAATATVRAEAPATFEAGSFKFTRPADWTWTPVPPQSMRKAMLAIPGKEGGEAAEVVFFHFGPGQGGGTKENITRWVGQITDKTAEEKIETKEVAGTQVTFVTASGTYQSGMPMGPKTPKTGYALLGAILEDAAGGSVFVRCTGPEALVKAATPAFHEMIASAKK